MSRKRTHSSVLLTFWLSNPKKLHPTARGVALLGRIPHADQSDENAPLSGTSTHAGAPLVQHQGDQFSHGLGS